jgi:hypothetical protein
MYHHPLTLTVYKELSAMNIYYVYQYLREDRTPYYIGKGKNDRAWVSHKRKNGTDLLPDNLNNIQILFDCLSEEEAIALEINLIKEHGRIDIGTGILRNMTDGGDGVSGYIPDSVIVARIAEKNRGKKRTTEFKQSRTGKNNSFYQKSHSEETRHLMSKNHADVSGSNNPMYGKTHPNKGVKGKWKWNDRAKAKVSGINNPMFGKISPNKGKTPAKLECPHCLKQISLGNFNRWHGNNCKTQSQP